MKIMIIEDEENILERLGLLVDWEEEGFEPPLKFLSAVEAFSYLEHEAVDVILTDIFMPVLKGMEFIKMVREQQYHCDIIILSGHNEFEFAQEAVELGVRRYLLKPISAEQLRKVLADVRRDISERMKLKDWIAIARTRLDEALPVVQNQFFNDLLSGRLSESEEIARRAKAAELKGLCGEFSCVALRKIGGNQESTLEAEVALRQIVKEVLKEKALYVMPYEGIELVILNERIRQHEIEILTESIRQNLQIKVVMGIGTSDSIITNLHILARQAAEAVKSIRKDSTIDYLYHADLCRQGGKHAEYPYSLEKQILDVIRFEEELPEDIMVSFFNEIMPPRYSVDEVKLILLQLLVAVKREADEAGVKATEYFLQAEHQIHLFENLEDTFRHLLGMIIKEKTHSARRYTQIMVEQVREQIDHNFSDQDLSVSLLAEALGVTPNYLSRIFSSLTGQTCMEYITGIRMEAAKKMLRFTDKKSYLIALETGYKNANYFSALFKKYTGTSPKEYREGISSET